MVRFEGLAAEYGALCYFVSTRTSTSAGVCGCGAVHKTFWWLELTQLPDNALSPLMGKLRVGTIEDAFFWYYSTRSGFHTGKFADYIALEH